MKYGVISDIHSNLEAFTTVLKEIDRTGVDRVICLGDIVGYGANPNECVIIVREREIPSIMGNHDFVACGEGEPDHFNQIAREAALWTRETLTEENMEFIRDLPELREINDFLIVHGAPSDPDKYILSTYDSIKEFDLMENFRLCFFGHTHVRISYVYRNEEVRSFFDNEFELDPKEKYMVNPGSVGQPRDRDPRASFLVYDSDNQTIQFTRVEYDVESAQRKIIEAELDKRLAERLAVGI